MRRICGVHAFAPVFLQVSSGINFRKILTILLNCAIIVTWWNSGASCRKDLHKTVHASNSVD